MSLIIHFSSSQCTALALPGPWHPTCCWPGSFSQNLPPESGAHLGRHWKPHAALWAQMWPRLPCHIGHASTALAQALPGLGVPSSTVPQMAIFLFRASLSGKASVPTLQSNLLLCLLKTLFSGSPCPHGDTLGTSSSSLTFFHLATSAERSPSGPGEPAIAVGSLLIGLVLG